MRINLIRSEAKKKKSCTMFCYPFFIVLGSIVLVYISIQGKGLREVRRKTDRFMLLCSVMFTLLEAKLKDK